MVKLNSNAKRWYENKTSRQNSTFATSTDLSLMHVYMWLTCDVIHHHSHGGVSYVARNETPETLLPRSVPQL